MKAEQIHSIEGKTIRKVRKVGAGVHATFRTIQIEFTDGAQIEISGEIEEPEWEGPLGKMPACVGLNVEELAGAHDNH